MKNGLPTRAATKDRRSFSASSGIAADILGRVFGDLPFGFAAKLWDGAQVSLGTGVDRFTLVFRNPSTLRRLMLRPNTLRFAEAFVSGDLDIEGDLFTAVRLASRIENLQLGLRDRMAIALGLLRL